jgi:hypothetical protein
MIYLEVPILSLKERQKKNISITCNPKKDTIEQISCLS